METRTMIRDFTQGSLFRKLITFALPLIAANLCQTAYNLVDMAVVGHYVGSEGLSAVSIGGDLLNCMTFLVIGFAGAGQVILSQYIGAGRRDRVNDAVGTMFTTVLAGALCMSAVCFLLVDEILAALNTPPEALADARAYSIVCILGLVFVYGYNAVSAVLRGLGDSRRPLLFIIVATVVNLVLDLIFVAGLGLGPLGAALATIIGQGASFLWAVAYLCRNREAFSFDFRPRSFIPDREILLLLIKLGIPMGFQHAAIQMSILFVKSYINAYGVVVSAVTGVGSRLGSVAMVVTNAMTTAGSSVIGQNLGAEKYDRVTGTVRTILLVDLAFAALLSAITISFPRAVFGLFNRETAVLDAAMAYVPVAVIAFFGFALRGPFMALINGSGRSRLNLLIGVLGGFICRVVLSMFLGLALELGVSGFWYGNVLAGYVSPTIGLLFFLSKRWMERPQAVRKLGG